MEDYESQGGLGKLTTTLGKKGLGRNIFYLIVISIIVIVGGIGLLEINEAGYITAKQSIVSGKVTIISEPGIFCQCFGRLTKYKEAGTFTFAKKSNDLEGKGKAKVKKKKEITPERSDVIEVRFNDGGIAWLSGVALFDLPKDIDKMHLLHQKFRNFDNLLNVLIVPTLKESVAFTAALMDSGESYMSKRATFTEWAWDQLEKGTYKTEVQSEETTDPNTGDITKKRIVKVKTDDDGNVMRSKNPLERYGITLKQFQITNISYEPDTEKIIKAKREALQKTISAKIAAERAIQERLAAVELGKKNVKIAEYKALVKKKKSEVEAEEAKEVAVIAARKKLEVGKIEKEKSIRKAKKKVELEKLDRERALVEAKKKLEVARIDAKSAERNRQTSIFDGQGLAEKRRLIYKADGALQQKLDAYVEVMKVLGKELGKQKWVPDITMGAGANGSSADGNAAMNFMNLWMMKTAKDLGVEMAADKKKR